MNPDILIIDAGPVGLFMANECHRHGLSCHIIEKKRKIQGISHYSQA